jgi:nucleoside-specific outer membrane channel protein Tsx
MISKQLYSNTDGLNSADVTAEIATDPFINQGQDMVAGWTMLLSLNIFDAEDWCAIPYDDYDFEN